MPTYDKEACPICGELISTRPSARVAHMRKHKPPEAENADEAEEKPAAGPAAQGGVSAKNMPEVKDNPELQKALARATRIVEQQQATAPDAEAIVNAPDPMKEKVEHCRKLGLIEPDMADSWHKTEDTGIVATRGYIPVIEEGEQVSYNELSLFKRPKTVSCANIEAAAIESRNRLNAFKNKGRARDNKDSPPQKGAD